MNEKKEYISPKMMVVELAPSANLLQNSLDIEIVDRPTKP